MSVIYCLVQRTVTQLSACISQPRETEASIRKSRGVHFVLKTVFVLSFFFSSFYISQASYTMI